MRNLQDFTDPDQFVILSRSDYDWLMEITIKLQNRFTQLIRVDGPVTDSKLLFVWFEIHLHQDDAFWWSSIAYELPHRIARLKNRFTIRPEKTIDEIVEEVTEQFNRGLRQHERLPY